MGWDAHLTDDRGHEEGWWNYTHNTSRMVYPVLEDAGIDLGSETRPDGSMRARTWWRHLDGMSGPEGAAFLNVIVSGLRADPARFVAMNPSNGWGDYDTFVKVLEEMRDSVPEWPTVWDANG